MDDAFVMLNGRKHRKRTTQGWDLCVEWADGTTSWEPLKNLKESNPIEVAEYAATQGLIEEPAFAWWAKYTLNRRKKIIKAVNKRYWKRTHKFGIRVPHSVQEAREIDRENGDDRWEKSIQKEMNKVAVA